MDSSVFTKEEWDLLKRAPIIVFHAVAKADDHVESVEVEKLIKQFEQTDRYQSSVFTEVVREVMSDPVEIAATVQQVLDDKDVHAKISKIQAVVDEKLSAEDAIAFKKGLVLLGTDIAAATGEADMPVSKDEWSEIETFKQLLKLS